MTIPLLKPREMESKQISLLWGPTVSDRGGSKAIGDTGIFYCKATYYLPLSENYYHHGEGIYRGELKNQNFEFESIDSVSIQQRNAHMYPIHDAL